MKKVSIIIPVYNVEKYLSKCLESVLNEKIEKEIIVINDGSTDDSLNIIKEYKKKNKEIVIINQKNQGQGSARNAGIKKATGKYICFIDSDDWINKGSLEKALKIAEKKDADILYWNIDWIYSNGEIKHQQIHSAVYSNNDNKGYLLSDPSPCNKLIKTDILKKYNLEFPVDCIYEDFAFIPSLTKYTRKIFYTDKITYNYYQRNNSTMNQEKYNIKLMDLIKAYNHLYDILFPEYKEELEYLAINQLIYFRTFELLKYNKKEEIERCVLEVREKFPYWKNNKYFCKRNILIKLYCKLISSKHYCLCKLLCKARKMLRK